MKKFSAILKAILPVMLAIVGMSACSSSSEDDPKPSGDDKVTVNPTSINFDATQQAPVELTVKSSKQVTVSSMASWCKVTPMGPRDGGYGYTAKCDDNTGDARQTTIKVYVSGKEAASVAVSQAAYVAPEPDDPTPPTPPVTNPTDGLGLGWNLGNQFDSHVNEVANETGWGNPAVTQQTMNRVKELGFTSVRIPVTWLGKVGDAPDYKIDQQWLDRVAEAVGYAKNAGLKVVINIHHDGANSQYWLDVKNAAKSEATNTAIKAKLSAMWKQIAQKFADKGDFLYFESMNEIHDGGWGWGDNRKDNGKQYKVFNEWQQVFVDAVRSAGGQNTSRWLGIPTYCTNIDLGDHLVMPSDPAGKLMVAVHCYEPNDFTLTDKYSEWGHTASVAKKHPTSDEKTLVAEFDKVVNKWIKKGIPAYIGEFGCVHRSTARSESFRKYYLEYFCKAAADRGIPIIIWDNGSTASGNEANGLLNHGTGAGINGGDEIMRMMSNAYFSTDPAYTLQSVYNGAPK